MTTANRPTLDLATAQPLLLTYTKSPLYTNVNSSEGARLPRMTTFLKGNPFDPNNTFNAQYAVNTMEMYLRNTLPNNAMVTALNESRKRRISDESMLAADTMSLLHGGVGSNIGAAPSGPRKRLALGDIANAAAALL